MFFTPFDCFSRKGTLFLLLFSRYNSGHFFFQVQFWSLFFFTIFSGYSFGHTFFSLFFSGYSSGHYFSCTFFTD